MTEDDDKTGGGLHPGLAHMVNLVQTLIGRLDFASERNLAAVSWQDQVSKRMTVLWWAYAVLFIAQALGDWFAPPPGCW